MSGSIPGGSGETPEPPALRRLRRLVTALTAVLIVGVITVVALLVIRLATWAPVGGPALPTEVALPAGESATAVTFGSGWVAVVTRDESGRERIRVQSPEGAPLGVLEIAPTAGE